MQVDIERFWRDGFLIIPKVFSVEKVAKWRHAALQPSYNRVDLLSDNTLRDLVLDPTLLSISRNIFGADPIYFGDSTAAIGTSGGAGFHKDNSDRHDAKAPDWLVDRYPIIRFGIYTQEHGEMPQGLDLRRGSHMYPDTKSGEHISAQTSPGDLIVWNGRTTHSANSQIIKGIGYRVLPSGVLSRILRCTPSDWLLMKHNQERVALFVTYAHKHPLLDRHISYLKSRTYAMKRWQTLNWSDETKVIARERELELFIPDLSDIGKTNDKYKMIDY